MGKEFEEETRGYKDLQRTGRINSMKTATL